MRLHFCSLTCFKTTSPPRLIITSLSSRFPPVLTWPTLESIRQNISLYTTLTLTIRRGHDTSSNCAPFSSSNLHWNNTLRLAIIASNLGFTVYLCVCVFVCLCVCVCVCVFWGGQQTVSTASKPYVTSVRTVPHDTTRHDSIQKHYWVLKRTVLHVTLSCGVLFRIVSPVSMYNN